jgi:hypothetical protein
MYVILYIDCDSAQDFGLRLVAGTDSWRAATCSSAMQTVVDEDSEDSEERVDGEMIHMDDIIRRVGRGMVPWVSTVAEFRARQRLLREIRYLFCWEV